MNVKDVSKRDVLDFGQFLSKVHDDKFKPFSPENQRDSSDKSGLSKITRQKAYDWVGYADAVFNNQSKIDSPGYRVEDGGKIGMSDAGSFGNVFNMDTSESQYYNDREYILRLSDL
jgi:hypothetical protein